jgi:hypothetical protein
MRLGFNGAMTQTADLATDIRIAGQADETIRRVVRAVYKLQAGLGKGWEAAFKNAYTK